VKNIAIGALIWAGSVLALGIIARVTYAVFMIGWGIV
jgi:hypothetical protein